MIKIKVCGMVDPVNLGEIAKTAPDFIGLYFIRVQNVMLATPLMDLFSGTFPPGY